MTWSELQCNMTCTEPRTNMIAGPELQFNTMTWTVLQLNAISNTGCRVDQTTQL
jgi:hypothetical protein